MYKLFLDDIRVPKDAFNYTKRVIYNQDDWVIVRSYDDFIGYILEHGLPSLISFDHDLADEHYVNNPSTYKEKTGYDCAKWLVDYCAAKGYKIPVYLIHSMNPVGSQNIKYLIESYVTNYE